jgi:hypothetical protein
MRRLVIKFNNLALFVNRQNGLTVLVPKEGHYAVITGLTPDPLTLSGHVIELRRDGDLIRERTMRTAGEYMLHLDALSPQPCPIKCGAELNELLLARIELGGGRLVESPLKHGDIRYKDCEWVFANSPTHKLTDYAEFQFEIADDSTYRVLVIVGEVATLYPLSADLTLEVTVGEDAPDKEVGGKLTEMQYLYDLLAGNPGLPLPTDPHYTAGSLHRASAPTATPHKRTSECSFPLCPNAQIEG